MVKFQSTEMIFYKSIKSLVFIILNFVHHQGAFIGAISGFIIAGWSSLGSNAMIGTKTIIPKKLPVDLTYCPTNISDDFLHQFPSNYE